MRQDEGGHNVSATLTVAIHWPRFGPYHLARLRAARTSFMDAGVEVIGLEIASRDEVYLWREEAAGDLQKAVIFPGRTYEDISPIQMLGGLEVKLRLFQPDVVAINGYSTSDSLGILLWCRRHRCPAILMSDSKADDTPRTVWKEWFKGKVVALYSAALCAGQLQRVYLEGLGMAPKRIFEGYDVVDNGYFWEGAERARANRAEHYSLLGLHTPEPFFLASARFVKRKNLDGLLRAYARYCRQLADTCPGQAPWRLVILGDGIEREALEHLVRAEGIQGVSFPGFCQVDVLPFYYGLATAFIHPARQEQWGLVVNEAMAAGLPVLVSNRCGCARDLISEGVNGFTFPPDDCATLTDLMLRTSSGTVDLRAMGVASRARIREWGLERFAQGLQGAVQVALQTSQVARRTGSARELRR